MFPFLLTCRSRSWDDLVVGLGNPLTPELPMANFFYTDENGTKHSINDQQLQTLAMKGVIKPETPLETDSGHTGLAGQIPGLQFNTAAPSPFAQMAQQNVAVPVAEQSRGSSWQVTLIGIVLISIVGGVGWSIIDKQQPEQANNAPLVAIDNVQVPPVNDAPVVPIENAQALPVEDEQNDDVQVAVPDPPIPNPPQAQPPKPTESNQANVLQSAEATKIGKQIDFVIQFTKNGEKQIVPMPPLTNNEKNTLVRFLIDAKKELDEEPEFSYDSLRGLLYNLYVDVGRYAEVQVYGKAKFGKQFDRYMVNREYAKSVVNDKKRRVVEAMLPESNRLSGSRHDAEERTRLIGQDLFK